MTDRLLLETFPNPHTGRDYVIEHHIHEFTSICPKTGQPDFGRITVRYVPDATCVELKGLKLYLQTFRDRGIFYEDVTNVILSDLLTRCQPKWIEVQSTWTIRGGIHSVITAREGRCPQSCDYAVAPAIRPRCEPDSPPG